MSTTIPILLYHQVTPYIDFRFSKYSVTPERFKFHMKILKLHGFNSINLDQLEEHRNGNAPLPHRPIIITFDDCFQESVDYAVPILATPFHIHTSQIFPPTNATNSSGVPVKPSKTNSGMK